MTKREEIKAVLKYRSGADSCNSVYVGSMATAKVCDILDITYGSDNINKAIDKADLRVIHRVHKYLYPGYIKYMRKNPVTKCKKCGQVIPAK